jgi:hypothetical protein
MMFLSLIWIWGDEGSSWVHGIPGWGLGLEGVVILKEIEVKIDVNGFGARFPR